LEQPNPELWHHARVFAELADIPSVRYIIMTSWGFSNPGGGRLEAIDCTR
jgi:hypothetical protein